MARTRGNDVTLNPERWPRFQAIAPCALKAHDGLTAPFSISPCGTINDLDSWFITRLRIRLETNERRQRSSNSVRAESV